MRSLLILEIGVHLAWFCISSKNYGYTAIENVSHKDLQKIPSLDIIIFYPLEDQLFQNSGHCKG